MRNDAAPEVPASRSPGNRVAANGLAVAMAMQRSCLPLALLAQAEDSAYAAII